MPQSMSWHERRSRERRPGPAGHPRFTAELAGLELPVRNYSPRGLQVAAARVRGPALRGVATAPSCQLLLRLFGEPPLPMAASVCYLEDAGQELLIGLELFPADQGEPAERWARYLHTLEAPTMRIVD